MADPDPVLKQIAKAIERSNELLRGIQKESDRNAKLSAAMLDALVEGDPASAREVLREYARDRKNIGDIEFETTTQEQGRAISEGRPQLGGRGFLQRLLTPQYLRPEREIDYIGYRRALGLGAPRGIGGFAERFGTQGYSLGSQIQQALVPYRPSFGEFATSEGERMIYTGGEETFSMLDEEQRGALIDPRNVDDLVEAGIVSEKQAKSVKASIAAKRGRVNKGVAKEAQRELTAEEINALPGVQKYQESLLGTLGTRGVDITGLGKSQALGGVAKILGGQSGRMGGGLAASLFDIGGGMMTGARAIAGPVGIALTAAQMAYEGVDKLYGMNRAGAALGYGFSRNPFDFLRSGTGANVALGRSIQTQMDALFSFGLSSQQTAAARAAVEGIGLGGRGNEKSYDNYYRSMTSVIENTGLDAQTLAPFYEQFMRAGGANKNIEDLTKMLRDDLPKAANQSRQSLQQMTQTLQQATQVAMQSPYNVRTPFEVQQAVTTAFEAGAPKGMENIAAGGNMFIASMAARRMGGSIFQAMQNPEEMNIAAVDLMRKTFGNMNGMTFDQYRRTDAGAMKVMQVQAMTGMDVSTMSQIYSEGPQDLETAQALAERFASGTSLGTMKGEKIRTFGGDYYDEKSGTWRHLEKGQGDSRSQFIMDKGKSTGVDIYRDKGSRVIDYYKRSGVIKTIEDALGAQGDKKEMDAFNKRLQEASGLQGDIAYKYIKEEAMKVAGDITKPGSGDGQITLSDEARRFFKLNFGSAPPATKSPNESHGPGQVTNVGVGYTPWTGKLGKG